MIEFDAASHTYRVDGRRVPNVTSILSPLYDLAAIPREVLEHKRALGQAVHRAIELELQNDLDESSLHPEVRQYMGAWRKWRAERDFRPYDSERKVAHKGYGYAGTLDLRGNLAKKLPGEKIAPGTTIIDLKTTFDVSAAVRLQLAAYKGALASKLKAAEQDKRLALQLKPDGNYKEYFYADPKDWSTFLSFLTCHNWKEVNL